MRSGKPRSVWCAAWLGLASLVFNALVPIHIAFDFAEALDQHHHEAKDTAPHSLEWRLFALATGHFGHDDEADHHGKSHHNSCPVCSSLSTLAGFAPTAIAALPVPAPITASIAVALTADNHDGVRTAAYWSRAPPVS